MLWRREEHTHHPIASCMHALLGLLHAQSTPRQPDAAADRAYAPGEAVGYLGRRATLAVQVLLRHRAAEPHLCTKATTEEASQRTSLASEQ
jgi:hypothetical protein